MELEIYREDSLYVVAWGSKDVYVKFQYETEAYAFAREMVSTFTGVTV